ncbi:MAG: hypothetical protein QG574_1002, partial [Cyanobacteriota bacterium erpe_2018_sw_21hr_WHONDRS-SW48-000092_B_bin.40]|nr:hypothetical protein [Cyanobacteriota bacterium erpe_2018_sw_21hr_WHONDRS-SW48-000092_B_bin.40]
MVAARKSSHLQKTSHILVRSLALSLALALQFSSLPALASLVEMKQAEGKPVQASLALPVANIGNYLLPDGQISVSGQLVEVGAVPEWLFDRHTILTGTLIRLDLGATPAATAAATPTNAATPSINQGSAQAVASSRLDGLVYFNGGDWLKNLRTSRISETVEAADGNTYVGRISTITADNLSIDTLPGQTRTLALANVKNIVSPFSYRFSAQASDVKLSPDSGMTTCDASTATFALARPLGQPQSAIATQSRPRMFGVASKPVFTLPKSTLAGTEGGISKKAITAMITVDAANTLAPMIALPLTMALGQGRAENTLNGYTTANRINDFF